jgi:DUF1009 family protein
MAERFCLVAGSGALVDQIVAAARGRALDFHVMSLTGPRDFGNIPVTECPPGDLDVLFTSIRAIEARFAVLAGYIKPVTWEALLAHLALGLKGQFAGSAEVARRLEAAFPSVTGASLVGIHEIAPELIAPDGPVAGPGLPDALRPNVLSALAQARELGWRDQGQAVVLFPDGALEAEDAGGTDALLSRIAARRLGEDRSGGPWILAKALKPKQPMTMDVPVIGPATVENARRAGISVIAVEAGGAVIVDRPMVEKAAAAAGISVLGLAF